MKQFIERVGLLYYTPARTGCTVVSTDRDQGQ